LEQKPAENKDPYGDSDLPCPRHLWVQPNQGQRKGPHTTDCHDNRRLSEIPLNLLFWNALLVGGIQKLTAVFTLYRVVLNFFSAEGTPFHYHLSWWNKRVHQLFKRVSGYDPVIYMTSFSLCIANLFSKY
jgi:hypothetical protein